MEPTIYVGFCVLFDFFELPLGTGAPGTDMNDDTLTIVMSK